MMEPDFYGQDVLLDGLADGGVIVAVRSRMDDILGDDRSSLHRLDASGVHQWSVDVTPGMDMSAIGISVRDIDVHNEGAEEYGIYVLSEYYYDSEDRGFTARWYSLDGTAGASFVSPDVSATHVDIGPSGQRVVAGGLGEPFNMYYWPTPAVVGGPSWSSEPGPQSGVTYSDIRVNESTGNVLALVLNQDGNNSFWLIEHNASTGEAAFGGIILPWGTGTLSSRGEMALLPDGRVIVAGAVSQNGSRPFLWLLDSSFDITETDADGVSGVWYHDIDAASPDLIVTGGRSDDCGTVHRYRLDEEGAFELVWEDIQIESKTQDVALDGQSGIYWGGIRWDGIRTAAVVRKLAD